MKLDGLVEAEDEELRNGGGAYTGLLLVEGGIEAEAGGGLNN